MQAKASFSTSLTLDKFKNTGIYQLPPPPNGSIPSPAVKLSELFEIHNFKAYACIKSLAEAQIPSFSLEDSETERIIKSLDIEWQSPRIQLNMYIGNPDNWVMIGALSLLNPSGYPYRIYDLLEIYTQKDTAYLGTNSSFGFAIKNVGYGGLQNDDIVNIYADFIRDVSYFVSQEQTVNVTTPEITLNIPVTVNSTGASISDGNSNNSGDINDMALQIKSTDYNIQKNERILVTAAASIYLPTSPTNGDEVEIYASTDSIVTVSSTPNTITRILQGQTSSGEQRANIGNSLGFGGKLIFNNGSWMCSKSEFGFQVYE